MDEHGWTPEDSAVERSEVEAKLAEMIGDESLTRLREKSDSTALTPEIAAAMRSAKGDRRLDQTPAEAASSEQLTEVITWVLLGISVIVVIAGTAFTLLFGDSIF